MTRRVGVRPPAIVVSCEHGGHELPPGWEHLAIGNEALLASHRGWDPGALELAQSLAATLAAPLVATTVTRLLVEVNRSPGHPRLFSELTRDLPDDLKRELLDRFYHPHRNRVEDAVRRAIAEHGRCLHLGIHTFTPILDGVARATDLGLLYDPRRPLERAFCAGLRQTLRGHRPGLVVHRNQPYRGATDGLTTSLRRAFAADAYLGIEVEVNQRFPLADRAGWGRIVDCLPAAVGSAL